MKFVFPISGNNHRNENRVRQPGNVTEQCIVTNANFLSHDKIEFAKQGMKLILPACRFKHLFPFKLESMRASKNAARINDRRRGENGVILVSCVSYDDSSC